MTTVKALDTEARITAASNERTNERTGILCGECYSVLKTLPDSFADCCITSPPYYGLRDYGVNGQIGLENTPQDYIRKLVDVFREVKRILRDDGTLWVNIGDSYAAQRGGTYQPAESLAGGKHGKTDSGQNVNRGRRDGYNPTRNASAIGLKHKDLIGIPWMLAFALREDGWYLRQDIIWHKPNPMPESVKDRFTKSHEYIFLLSKNQKYYFDFEAIKETATSDDARPSTLQKARDKGCQTKDKLQPVSYRKPVVFGGKKYGESDDEKLRIYSGNEYISSGTRNKRDVWDVPTQPIKEAHFATFPEKLIEPCILAGSRKEGIVLDPFFGSGTTGRVALRLNRRYLGIELNPDYIRIAEKRVNNTQMSLLGFID